MAEIEVEMPSLAIPTDKVCFILMMARQFDEKVAETDPDSGSNPVDDANLDVLEDGPNDAVQAELQSFLKDLNVDERNDLIALALLGRGDADLSEWQSLQAQARDIEPARTARFLLDLPLLSDYLGEGLAAFGRSCVDTDAE